MKIIDGIFDKNAIVIKKDHIFLRIGSTGPDPERMVISHENENAVRLTFYFILNDYEQYQHSWLPKKVVSFFTNGGRQYLRIPLWLAVKERIV